MGVEERRSEAVTNPQRHELYRIDKQLGTGWENGLIPFDEHDAMNSTIEELTLMAEGLIPGYNVTEPNTFDH